MPSRLHAILGVVRDARALAYGARTPDAALFVLGQESVDLFFVGEGLEGDRLSELPSAVTECFCVLVTSQSRALRPSERKWIAERIVWPFDVADVAELGQRARRWREKRAP